MKLIEEYFEEIKIISSISFAFVIGIEFTKELRKTPTLRGYVKDDSNTFMIMLFITTIMYLWLENGDYVIEYIIGNKNKTIITIISIVLGYYIFKISGLISLFK